MNINKYHVNSDVQARDKAFGTILRWYANALRYCVKIYAYVNVICQIDI